MQGDEMVIYDPTRGEYIDEETGEVLEEKIIETNFDYRFYDDDQYVRRSRHTILRPLYHDYGLFTFDIPKNLMYIHLESKKRLDYYDRVLIKMFRMLIQVRDVLKNEINIPEEVLRTSAYIIRKYVSKTNRVSRKFYVVLASIVLAYKINNYYVNGLVKKMERIFLVNSRDISKMYNIIIKRLNMSVEKDISKDPPHKNNNNVDLKIVMNKINDVEKNIEKFYNVRDDECLRETIKRILNKLRELMMKEISLTNLFKNNKTLAASIIYVASEKCMTAVTQIELSKMYHVSEVSIRKYVKDLRRILGEDLGKE
jgi:transcription initiation factor TFIIIB Brf1 subunit/transcription initiation factor TFIIB